MEKIKLNNQVVLMRKHVKQAKVHSINKLVKQVKLLQNRKGNENQVLKAKRKAERYLQEISLLKKVKPDYVSKLALSKAKDWKEILSQKNSILEDRCIAILASYGPVQKEVEIFYNSNKDIVSKISDLIKQWEEKSNFQKDSTPKKKFDLKALQSNEKLLKRKMTEGLLNDKTNQSQVSNKSSNIKIDSKNEGFLKQCTQNSVSKSSQNSFLIKKVSDESPDNEYMEKNKMEIENSNQIENKPIKLLDNDSKNELENYIDSNAYKVTKIDCESGDENESDIEKNDSENDIDVEKNESKNDFDIEKNESENDDSELDSYPDNELKSENTKVIDTDVKKLKASIDSEFNKDQAANKKSIDSENLTSSCLIPVKMDCKGSKSSENKLKAIAVLNLDDLRDLDEIPVYNSVENNESSSEEEEDTDNRSQNDPFFLGRDEAVSFENKLVDDPKSNKFVSINEIFERKEKSNNHSNSTKTLQKKPLNSSRFSSKYSSDFKNEKNFKVWQKDNLMPKHHQDKFQRKSKGSFESEHHKGRFQPYKYKKFDRDFKNQKHFSQETCFEAYRNNKQKNSNDLYHTNGDNSSRTRKEPHKKNDANIKPLHPSWEAKRKQKELTNMSFQGKKIVFKD